MKRVYSTIVATRRTMLKKITQSSKGQFFMMFQSRVN